MPSDRIFEDVEHDVTTVGIDLIAFGNIYFAGIVDGATGRDRFTDIVKIERQKIRNLLAERIDNFQALALVQAKRDTASRRDFMKHWVARQRHGMGKASLGAFGGHYTDELQNFRRAA